MPNLVVIGDKNHGKTHIIKALELLLIDKKYSVINLKRKKNINNPHADTKFIVEINGIKIGVNSQGDAPVLIKRGYWSLHKHSVDFYVLVSHNRKSHFDVLDSLLGVGNYKRFYKDVGEEKDDKNVAIELLNAILKELSNASKKLDLVSIKVVDDTNKKYHVEAKVDRTISNEWIESYYEVLSFFPKLEFKSSLPSLVDVKFAEDSIISEAIIEPAEQDIVDYCDELKKVVVITNDLIELKEKCKRVNKSKKPIDVNLLNKKVKI